MYCIVDAQGDVQQESRHENLYLFPLVILHVYGPLETQS